jgi:hypothetical protein
MDKKLAQALIYASKTVRKTLEPLYEIDELTPELIRELKKLQAEMRDWEF